MTSLKQNTLGLDVAIWRERPLSDRFWADIDGHKGSFAPCGVEHYFALFP